MNISIKEKFLAASRHPFSNKMANMAIAKFQEFHQEMEDWTIYEKRLDQHYMANAITDEKVKLAVLLNSIEPITYKLLRDLCYLEIPKQK